jgi:trigger factor
LNVTSCEKKENVKAELTVVVSPEEFDKALEESFRKNRAQISVPGFRKGKAPRKLIENMYGAQVFYDDALEIILPTVCSHGVSESDLQAIGYPQILDIEYGDDKSVTVKYAVELYPEVTVGEYKGIKAVKPDVAVEESAVDSEIASLRLRNARIQTADRPLSAAIRSPSTSRVLWTAWRSRAARAKITSWSSAPTRLSRASRTRCRA